MERRHDDDLTWAEPTWTDAHERLLAAAAPPVPEVDEADLDRLWEQATTPITLPAGPRPRGARRAGVAAGVFAVVLGTSGVAAAGWWSARTGGDELAPAAPDFSQVVAEELRSVPFPSEVSRQRAVDVLVGREQYARLDERTRVAVVRADGADEAVCAWTRQWAEAVRAGREPERRTAAAALDAAVGWDATTAVDPQPYARTERVRVVAPDGSVTWEEVRDTSRFHYLGDLVAAVDRGDVATAQRVTGVHASACTPDGNG